jgi:poly-gamma-glutamate capsule biosynthesis protein CapA/YwtB (metallophosphatase superfamily)
LSRPRRIAAPVALALSGLLLVACGGGPSPSGLATQGTASSTTTSSVVATSAPIPTSSTVPAGPVTFAFAGDVHFEGVLRGQLDEDPAGLLAPIAPVLGDADLTVVNLETAITQRGTAATKDYTFRAPESAYTALASAGVDVANVANNHGMDFGDEGLTDTLYSAAINGFPLIGIGNDASEAFRPYEATLNGQQIAVFGATQVLDGNLIDAWSATDSQGGLANALDPDRLVAAVSEVRPRVDTLVVYLHWGTEGETCPTERQQTLGDELVAAGADIVVGSHAHRLQGGGRDGAAFIDYGLGNFVFYSPDGSPGAATGVLKVTATGRTIDSYEWVPATIRSGVPTPLEGDEATQAQVDWQALRDCTDLTE